MIVLLERTGEVISKQDIIGRVWGSMTVADSNLKTQVAAVRRALRDGLVGNGYICTVTGRGYCFVATVTTFDGSMAKVITDRNHVLADAPIPPLYRHRFRDASAETLRHPQAVRAVSRWHWRCRSRRATS
ncbi:MAG: winged helix-turn-helix domain-containing protein [Acetobacteraceae bacterium]|nr:winged helix-turn-helix domain-containing protein [Acetobacteraceae bacterium]